MTVCSLLSIAIGTAVCSLSSTKALMKVKIDKQQYGNVVGAGGGLRFSFRKWWVGGAGGSLRSNMMLSE